MSSSKLPQENPCWILWNHDLILSFVFGQSSEPRMPLVAPMFPSSGEERAWLGGVWISPLQMYTPEAYKTWNLKMIIPSLGDRFAR